MATKTKGGTGTSSTRAARDRRELLVALGGRVRRARAAKAMSQAALADKLGISVAYVSLIERGRRNPPYRLVAALTKALGTSAATLVE